MKVKVKIKVRGKDVPDWGLGEGILAEQEMEMPDSTNRISVALAANNLAEELIKDTIETITEYETT